MSYILWRNGGSYEGWSKSDCSSIDECFSTLIDMGGGTDYLITPAAITVEFSEAK